MKRKLLILGTTVVLGVLSSFNSLAAMELKETTTAYLLNDKWKEVNNATYFQDGLADGWHEENGNTFYILNGNAVTLNIKIDGNGIFSMT